MDNAYLIACILGLSCINIALRGTPFLIPRKYLTTRYFRFLGRFLPGAIMALMVSYCLHESFTPDEKGILFLFGMIGVAVLHVLTKNFLISVGFGSAAYLLLVNYF